MNLVEKIVSSRKDWNQNDFKKLLYSMITKEDQDLKELELRKKIEGFHLGYKYPNRYDKYGNYLESYSKTINEISYFDKNQSFKKDKQIKHIDIEDEPHISFFVEVKDVSDYVYAFKEILWKLGNIPSTSKNILQHIVKVDNSGIFTGIFKEDYPITNTAFQKAVNDFDLELIKQKNNQGKYVYLYKNPTDKRQGFYYQGRLLSLKQLSDINNVPVVTIKKRISKGFSVKKAIEK
jgi:hypothetical protein